MHRFRARSGPGLRLVLALALFLAGLAGARMQGAMAAGAALGVGALCSGAHAPEEGGPAAHAGCLACPLPFAAAPDAPQPPARAVSFAERAAAVAPPAPAAAEISRVHCRGPPPAG